MSLLSKTHITSQSIGLLTVGFRSCLTIIANYYKPLIVALYCYGGSVDNFKYVQIESDIQSALKLSGWVKSAKVFLAALIVFVYFFYPSLLLDVIVIAVVFSLLLPLGFFDTFIQKLLEYNTQKSEDRQILNATEANEHFEKIYKKFGK